MYLFILHKVLLNINIVVNKLQEKTATLGQSKNIIQGVIMTFKNSRTSEYFSQLWYEIETFAKDNEILIQTPYQGEIYTYKYIFINEQFLSLIKYLFN